MYERTYTVGLAPGAGPDFEWQGFELPPGDYDVEAWISNFGSSNVHLVTDKLQLVEAQARLERGLTDVIMTLGAGAPVRVHLKDSFANGLGVFFEAVNTSGQWQVVTLKVSDCSC